MKKKQNNLLKEHSISFLMKNSFLILGLCLLSTIGFGQLEINAELRPRAEVRHGYKAIPKEDADAATFVSQRTRLNFYYSHSKFKIGIGIQDVRVWGDEMLFTSTGVFGDQSSLDLNEGWLEIIAGPYNSFRIGRQYWVYEDERLLSRRNWNQSTIKYDGLLYKFEKEKMKFHLGLSLNNSSDNLVGNDYLVYNNFLVFDTANDTIITKKELQALKIKSQNFIYLSKKINDNFNVSFQAFATGFQKPSTKSTIYIKGTYGLYLNYKQGIWAAKANGFYQNGKNSSGKKVSAYFAHLKGEMRPKPFIITAGTDYHSGHDQAKGNENYQSTDHFFDLFYGVRHRYYGYMDLFENLSKASDNGGLFDAYTGFGAIIKEKFQLMLDLHYFSLQSRVKDPFNDENVMDKPLGPEIDFTYDLTIIPELVISGGVSYMLPTSTMKKLQGFENGGNGEAYWVWAMITVKPTLFKSDK